jgi:hypothetical protein
MSNEKNSSSQAEIRSNLTHLPPTVRIVWTKQEFGDVPSGEQMLILALSDKEKPVFEVEWKGRIRHMPIDYFNSMYLSDEISGLFNNWKPS